MQRVARAGRVAHGVRHAVIDRIEPRGVEVVEPGDLHRRRLASEHGEPVVPGVAGDVDQDVDAIVADPLRDRHVANALHHARRHGAEPIQRGGRLRVVEIRKDVEFRAIVAAQHGFHERGQRGVAIGRDIPHAQPPLRVRHVRRRHVLRAKFAFVMRRERAVQREDVGGRVARGQLCRREQVGERGPEGRHRAQCLLVGRERGVDAALLLVEVAEVVQRFGGIRLQVARPFEGRHRAVDVAGLLQRVAEVHMHGQCRRIERQRRPVRGDGVVRARKPQGDRAEVGPRCRVAGHERERVLEPDQGIVISRRLESVGAEAGPGRRGRRRIRGERRQDRDGARAVARHPRRMRVCESGIFALGSGGSRAHFEDRAARSARAANSP